jgi:signal transduction histidine kinase
VKLLYKSTLYFFIFLIFAFIIGGYIFYVKSRSIINQQIDSGLVTEKNIIEEEILETNVIPDFTEIFFEHQVKAEFSDKSLKVSLTIKDTSIYNEKKDLNFDYRVLEFTSNTKQGRGYSIVIFQSVETKKDLLKYIALALLILVVFLLIISLLINYGISKNLWRNFNDSLNKISSFDISSSDPLNLSETNIKEFRQLNDVLTQMSLKMKKDYRNLKEFNENASHEIQSPLAIIRSHLELLFQNESLTESQMKSLSTIKESVNRLSRLNQGLLLISKIDNQQFKYTGSVSVGKVTEKLLSDFEEIISLKNIRVSTEFLSASDLKINADLAVILISNLISNAVRYNTESGEIKIAMDENSFSIINTGPPLKSNPESLFERFSHESHSPDSVGLGLSIVKRITDYYGMQVSYKNRDNLHELKIEF